MTQIAEDLAAQVKHNEDKHMIKRDIVETVYEYDKEGKLVSKTVTETHEEDTNITTNTPPSWWTYDTSQNWPPYITCTNSNTNDYVTKNTITMAANDKTTF